jgi:hypothetical protein
MLLVKSLRLLLSDKIITEDIELAEKLLTIFYQLMDEHSGEPDDRTGLWVWRLEPPLSKIPGSSPGNS